MLVGHLLLLLKQRRLLNLLLLLLKLELKLKPLLQLLLSRSPIGRHLR